MSNLRSSKIPQNPLKKTKNPSIGNSFIHLQILYRKRQMFQMQKNWSSWLCLSWLIFLQLLFVVPASLRKMSSKNRLFQVLLIWTYGQWLSSKGRWTFLSQLQKKTFWEMWFSDERNRASKTNVYHGQFVLSRGHSVFKVF